MLKRIDFSQKHRGHRERKSFLSVSIKLMRPFRTGDMTSLRGYCFLPAMRVNATWQPFLRIKKAKTHKVFISLVNHLKLMTLGGSPPLHAH